MTIYYKIRRKTVAEGEGALPGNCGFSVMLYNKKPLDPLAKAKVSDYGFVSLNTLNHDGKGKSKKQQSCSEFIPYSRGSGVLKVLWR